MVIKFFEICKNKTRTIINKLTYFSVRVFNFVNFQTQAGLTGVARPTCRYPYLNRTPTFFSINFDPVQAIEITIGKNPLFHYQQQVHGHYKLFSALNYVCVGVCFLLNQLFINCWCFIEFTKCLSRFL